MISDRLARETTLSDRTDMCPEHICKLLSFCLDNTYFVYNGNFYGQKRGAALGSPVSPMVANLYMEYFEKALSTAPFPPHWWDRYVDHTDAAQPTEKINELHQLTKYLLSMSVKFIPTYCRLSISFQDLSHTSL